MTEKEKLEKLKKLANAMYYAAQYLTTDASGLHKAMEEYHKFIINEYHKEETVSEDLENAADECAEKAYPYTGGTKGIICETSKPIFKKGFKAGAQWQKEKDESYTKSMYKVGINAGKELMKQQMMKDAKWCTIVKRDTGISLQVTDKEIIRGIKNYEYVNVIILKEE